VEDGTTSSALEGSEAPAGTAVLVQAGVMAKLLWWQVKVARQAKAGQCQMAACAAAAVRVT
jgi:hypothetical protein